MALQDVGMIVTDLAFPRSGAAAYARFQRNIGCLRDRRHLGITIYDQIDATSVRDSFRSAHNISCDELNIGMLTIEAVWPWRHRGPYETGAEMHLRVVRSLLREFTTIPIVMLCREPDAFWVRRECAAVGLLPDGSINASMMARIQFVEFPHYWLHYVPLQMRWTQSETLPVEGSGWVFMYIHPVDRRRELPDPFWLPAEILKLQMTGKRTMCLAAGTCESQVHSAAYVSLMCDEHGYDQHGPPDPVAMPSRMCPINDQFIYDDL